MDIEHIREFTELSKAKSLSVCARQLYISQSTLSRHISSMETELDVELLQRGTNKIVLTQEGKAFLQDAFLLVSQYDNARIKLDTFRDTGKRLVSIGYLRSATGHLVPSILHRIEVDHPGYKVMMYSREYPNLTADLLSRRIDVALTMDIDPTLDQQCNSLPLYEDRLHVIVGRNSTLASRDSISIAELSSERLILPHPSRSAALYRQVTRILGASPLMSETNFFTDIDTMFLDISLGKGIAVGSGHHRRIYGDDFSFIPIEDVDTAFSVSAMWLKDADISVIQPILDIVDASRKLTETVSP